MLTLRIRYDDRHDILYAHIPENPPSYGDESEDNIVTYYGIDNGQMTGMAIMGFKNRIKKGTLNISCLPLCIDLNNDVIKNILAS